MLKQINRNIQAYLVFILTMIGLIVFSTLQAQSPIRFKENVFDDVDSMLNIEYGVAKNINNKQEHLLLDVFMPKGDTLKKRPMLIFVHGGGFQNNTKTGAFSSLVCNGLAKKGYVTATIDYRLGIAKPKTDTAYFEACVRAVQDAKASVRYFKRYADKYCIDTNQIFIMGSSAGSKTAMHLAYLDQDELPDFMKAGEYGDVEGKSGNEGYSSKVAGVINCWGALINYIWMNNNRTPIFNISGTADKTVPYDSSYAYHGFKYGAKIIYQHALKQGISTGYRPFFGAGHTLDNNKQKQDSALQDISAWLYTQLLANQPKKSEISKWEADIKKLEKSNPTSINDSVILFIGSSYIKQWGNISTSFNTNHFINFGFGGSKLNEVAYFIDRLLNVCKHLKGVVLYVGNDITGSNQDKTPEQVGQLVNYITNQIREKNPQIPIVWLAINPSEKRWKVWSQIQAANNKIEQYCTLNTNTYFINKSADFLGSNGLPKRELYKEDKLHFNEQGYTYWTSLLKDEIFNIFKIHTKR